MQTFLTNPRFDLCAKALDNRRLGKQRVEAMQILKVNYLVKHRRNGEKIAWENHPAVLMWRNHSVYLYEYLKAICNEWCNRGYVDNCLVKAEQFVMADETEKPRWLSNKALYLSHQSNLIRKDPEYYRKQFGQLRDDMPYVWPVRKK